MCGSLLPEGDVLGIFVYVNSGLTCNTVMEKPFYTSCDDIVCFQCGVEDPKLQTDEFYPLCDGCRESGIKPTKKVSRKVRPNTKDKKD